MSDHVSEALLEMLYYEPLRSLFEGHLGLQVVRIVKPSTRQEVFYGFDQGWVHTGSTSSFLAELKVAIAGGSTVMADHHYYGYFLQFKRAEIVRHVRRTAVPAGFTSPYIRFPLDMAPNTITRRSQHETLLRLAGIKNSDVSYACPMLIHPDDVLAPVTLDTLRIVPITSAPQGYATNTKHHILFQDQASMQPYWCSEPQKAAALTAAQWVQSLRGPGLMKAGELGAFLNEVSAKIEAPRLGYYPKWEQESAPLWPACLTILELAQPLRTNSP